MARKLRVEYAGAIYHVMNRGDRREPIFRDDHDRLLFLETLGQTCQKTDWRVLAQIAERVGASHYGAELQEATEAKAEGIVVAELKRLRWTEAGLQTHRKGDPKKARLARRLRQETTMTLKWIAARLRMGTSTHVTNRLYHLKK